MTEDMYMMTVFFGSAVVITLVITIGLPLVRAYIRRQERVQTLSPGDAERDERLARIETAIEAMALETERISEGQRFVTKLLAERETPKAIPTPASERTS